MPRSFFARILLPSAVVPFLLIGSWAQNKTQWTDQEKPIVDQINTLRKLDDKVRAQTTKDLALQVRKLPAGPHKLAIASGLASLSTEGDFGRDTLQEVTTTLEAALREHPPAPSKDGGPNHTFMELASLVRYEHMKAESDNPQFTQAMAQLEKADAARQNADFTLTDLEGESWHMQELRGKVLLVNFWATWCPPCRKEMPDLQALFEKYKNKGLIIFSISDEEEKKVRPFIQAQNITYPVMLDPGGKVHELFQVEGIPKSFVYDREGNLVAQSIDMRTRSQFEGMLAAAGLK
jgi:peroxiredoxin